MEPIFRERNAGNCFGKLSPLNLIQISNRRYLLGDELGGGKIKEKAGLTAKLPMKEAQNQAPRRSFKGKWDDNVEWISKVAGTITGVATLALVDIFIIGNDLLLAGIMMAISGNIEFIGVVVGLPIAIAVDTLVFLAGYRIGRSLDPDSGKGSDFAC